MKKENEAELYSRLMDIKKHLATSMLIVGKKFPLRCANNSLDRALELVQESE